MCEKESGFSPCGFRDRNFLQIFAVAGAKAMTILPDGGTTKVVP